MAKKQTVIVNGRRVLAHAGQTLVNAALAGGMVIPTDCSSGQCDTCRVCVVSGDVDDAGTRHGSTVLACQARLLGPAEIAYDEAPPVKHIRGDVQSVRPLAPDVLEVMIRPDQPIAHRPGQYARFTFPGCPSRDYSPTASVADQDHPEQIALHVRIYPRGIVSNALQESVRPGDRVGIEGPFGSAYYRAGTSRLVLVGTGTGWAPLWAIARSALASDPRRRIKVVVGARDSRHLYMRKSLAWLGARGVDDITLSCTGRSGREPDVQFGRTTDFLADLTASDTVYAAGSAPMVNAVLDMADSAGAVCYTDPFTTADVKPSMFQRLRLALETGDDAGLRPGTSRRPERTTDGGSRDSRGGAMRPESQTPRTGLSRWLSR